MSDVIKAVDVVYVDLSKAFNKSPHDRLIQKVKAHGIPGDLVKPSRSAAAADTFRRSRGCMELLWVALLAII